MRAASILCQHQARLLPNAPVVNTNPTRPCDVEANQVSIVSSSRRSFRWILEPYLTSRAADPECGRSDDVLFTRSQKGCLFATVVCTIIYAGTSTFCSLVVEVRGFYFVSSGLPPQLPKSLLTIRVPRMSEMVACLASRIVYLLPCAMVTVY